MRSTRCMCGATFQGETREDLFLAQRAHADQAHPELKLNDACIKNYLEAEERLTGGTERLLEIGPVETHEATAERLDDLLSFLDHDAFAGNPAWASCYCVFHQLGGPRARGWENRTAAENRGELAARVRAGTTTGILAYAGGRLAGWCNASPRSTFPALAGRDILPDHEVGSIVCFLVAPPFRRHGVAERLLEAACLSFARRGMRVAEGYPAKETRGDAGAFHGPLSLYEGAGFVPVAETGNLIVVQKPI